jgi:hypothetical protein
VQQHAGLLGADGVLSGRLLLHGVLRRHVQRRMHRVLAVGRSVRRSLYLSIRVSTVVSLSRALLTDRSRRARTRSPFREHEPRAVRVRADGLAVQAKVGCARRSRCCIGYVHTDAFPFLTPSGSQQLEVGHHVGLVPRSEHQRGLGGARPVRIRDHCKEVRVVGRHFLERLCGVVVEVRRRTGDAAQ